MVGLALGVLWLVVGIHFLIMACEIFPWAPHTPKFLQTLQSDLGFAEGQAVHASPIVRNAGLFNGFIAAGLMWGMLTNESGFQIRAYFLGCIIIAGIFGACTLPWKSIKGVKVPITILAQTLPAALALALDWLVKSKAL